MKGTEPRPSELPSSMEPPWSGDKNEEAQYSPAIGGLYWASSFLSPDQGGSIELGNSLGRGSVPFIDFHYGIGSDQDYNARIINDGDRVLTAEASLHVTDGLVIDQ